jgi:hypothetical protein
MFHLSFILTTPSLSYVTHSLLLIFIFYRNEPISLRLFPSEVQVHLQTLQFVKNLLLTIAFFL